MQLSGTSFSAPMVAGAAAMLLAQHPDWTPDQVKGALMVVRQRDARGGAALARRRRAQRRRRRQHGHEPAEPERGLDQFLATAAGRHRRRFDSCRLADRGSNDAAWSDAAWSDAAWSDAAWSDAAWASAAWGDAAWSDAAWSDAAWSDAAWSDSACRRTGVATRDAGTTVSAATSDIARCVRRTTSLRNTTRFPIVAGTAVSGPRTVPARPTAPPSGGMLRTGDAPGLRGSYSPRLWLCGQSQRRMRVTRSL